MPYGGSVNQIVSSDLTHISFGEFSFLPSNESTTMEMFKSSSVNSIVDTSRRIRINSNLVSLGLKTFNSNLRVLDYGCGNGWDLSSFSSMKLEKIVGYNMYDYMFSIIK